MNKILSFKKIVSIGFFAVLMAVFLSAGTAQAGFWDWLNLNKASQDVSEQTAATANADTTSSSSSSSSSTSANHTAKTGSALDITSTSASLNGTINPKGENISVYFKYRKESGSSDATKTTNWTSTGSKSNDVITSVKISDLSSGTKYVYRFYAYNYTSGKTINGDLKSFTTSSDSSSSSSSQSSSSVSSGVSSSSSSVQQYTLKVKISGAGKITSSGGSSVINCKKSVDSKGKTEITGSCSIKFNKGESVTLTPLTPSAQYEFATWAEDCRSAQKLSSCTIKMSGNKTVSATFNKKAGSGEETAAVSVRKTGKGSGKVVSMTSTGKNMSGINCGNDCSENFKQYCDFEVEGNRRCGTVYFKATAEKGSTFGGWGGDCLTFKNEKDQCYVILDGAKTVNASFNEGSGNAEGKYYDLEVKVSAGGTVKSADSKIDCDSSNSPCKHSYGKNGTVTLKITPNSGYALGDYSGCSKSGNVQSGVLTCKTKMTQNRNVKVSFKTSGTTSSSSSSSNSATVKIKNVGTGMGYAYVYSYKDGKNSNIKTCRLGTGTTCEVEQSAGVALRILAKPYQSSFDSWESGCESTQKVSVSGDFCNLTVSSSGNTVNVKFTKSSSSSSSSSAQSSSSSVSSGASSSQTTSSTYKLKVTISGNGRIQDSYSKIDCGSNMACEATYSKGQMIRIKTEDTDSTGASYNTKVESWSGGGCSGTSNSCEITMDGDKEVTVKFISK